MLGVRGRYCYGVLAQTGGGLIEGFPRRVDVIRIYSTLIEFSRGHDRAVDIERRHECALLVWS